MKHILSFPSREEAQASRDYLAHFFGLGEEAFSFSDDDWGTNLTFITAEPLASGLRGRLIRILQPDDIQFNQILEQEDRTANADL